MNRVMEDVSAAYFVEGNAVNNQRLYKNSTVGLIPEDWVETSIGQLNPFVTSGSRGWAPYYSDVGDLFVRITNLNRDEIKLDLRDSKFVRLPSESTEGLRTGLSFGDLLISITADIGLIGYVDEKLPVPAYINQHLALVRFRNQDVDAKFAAYFLTSSVVQAIFRGMTDQGAKAGLGLSSVRSIPLALPPYREQLSISKAINDMDLLIVQLEKLIAKKQAIKAATMQQLLTGRTRLPQFALWEDGSAKGYKSGELGEIPEDWKVTPLGALAGIQRGASPRPIDSPVWFDEKSPVGWLRISDVTKASKFLSETTQSLSAQGVSNSRFVPSNNVVMSICATVGKPVITGVDLCIHDGFVVFGEPKLNKNYLYYVLKKLEPEWGKQGQTGSQMNLNTELINTTLILLPMNEDEQIEMAAVLSDFDVELEELSFRLEKNRKLKLGMMQQLLTGKVRLVKPSTVVSQ